MRSHFQLIQRWTLVFLTLMPVFGIAQSSPNEEIVLWTERKQFGIRLIGLERPEHVNHLHGVDIFLSAPDGKAVAGADITVTAHHRYALNPLPTSPRVLAGGQDGAYRLDGLRFHIAGEWQLVLAIDHGRTHDQASLDILVK